MNKQELIRTFICIEIPGTIRQQIEELQNKLKSLDAEVSWVRTSNIHLTLKFLGNVSQPKARDVCAAMERASRGRQPIDIEVSGTGCFPSLRSPRVLWVGFTNLSERLEQLQEAIEDELARLGFPREKRSFAPHLTIGRFRSQRNAHALVEAMMVAGIKPVKFQAREIIVMRSNLKPTGAVYMRQATIPLGGLI
jgi:2'-5' RNA ligase